MVCTRRKAVLREAELEGLGEDLGHRDLKQKTRGNGTPQPHPPCKESTCKYPTSADINDPLSVLVATCSLVAAVFVATEAASPLAFREAVAPFRLAWSVAFARVEGSSVAVVGSGKRAEGSSHNMGTLVRRPQKKLR